MPSPRDVLKPATARSGEVRAPTSSPRSTSSPEPMSGADDLGAMLDEAEEKEQPQVGQTEFTIHALNGDIKITVAIDYNKPVTENVFSKALAWVIGKVFGGG